MNSINCGVDLKGGHLVQGNQMLVHPRYELLFGSLKSQKSQQLLNLHRKYKQRLMHPLQINQKLRMFSDLDFLVPERDFLTWVQFSGLETNREVEKLMEHVKDINKFSHQVFKGEHNQGGKVRSHSENVLKKHLSEDVYRRLKSMQRRRMQREKGQPETVTFPTEPTITDVDERCCIGKEEKDGGTGENDVETLAKQLSEIQQKKKNLKQLNKNVYFRYTDRKLLLLRSLGSLPSREEIIKTFFQKTENNYLEKEQEFREKLKQQMSSDARLILTHKQSLFDFQQRLRGRGSAANLEQEALKRCNSASIGAQERQSVGVMESAQTSREGRGSYRPGQSPVKKAPEVKPIFPSTLQHLDEVHSSTAFDSERTNNGLKEKTLSFENIKKEKRMIKDIKAASSTGSFGVKSITSRGLISTCTHTKQDVSIDENQKASQVSIVYERNSVDSSGRKVVPWTCKSPEKKPRVKILNFTRTMTPGSFSDTKPKMSTRQFSRSKLMEIANRTPEKRASTKQMFNVVQSSVRLETEPGDVSSFREERGLCRADSQLKMQETERLLNNVWNPEPEPRNTVGHTSERKSVERETEALLTRDYSLAEARKSLPVSRIRCRSKSNQRGVIPREMLEKTEKTLKDLMLRKQKTFDLDHKNEMIKRFA